MFEWYAIGVIVSGVLAIIVILTDSGTNNDCQSADSGCFITFVFITLISWVGALLMLSDIFHTIFDES